MIYSIHGDKFWFIALKQLIALKQIIALMYLSVELTKSWN